jgi:hypothetical protein
VQSSFVCEFEKDSGEERLLVGELGWRSTDLDDGFESEAELAGGEVLGKDL